MLVVMETSATGAPDAPGGRPGMDGVPPAGGAGRGPGGAPGTGAPAASSGCRRGRTGRGRGSPASGSGGGAYGQLMINDLIPWVDRHFRTLADKDHRAMAGLSMGGRQTATVTMVNLDKFSYIGFFSGGAATGPAAAAVAPRRRCPRRSTARSPLDLKTIYNGAMADPAEFNRKVKVLFMSFGSAGESRRLEEAPGTAHRRRNQQQLCLPFSRHHARMADLEKEPVRFRSTFVPVGLLGDVAIMKRALFLALFAGVLAAGVCFAQTKKASGNSKPSARQELSPAPVASPVPPPYRHILTRTMSMARSIRGLKRTIG